MGTCVMTSEKVEATTAMVTKAQYWSASVEERETVVCFLVYQEIKVDPRLTQKPVVEQRSSGQPA